MKRKILISDSERTTIVAALVQYELYDFAAQINERWLDADSTTDGPEIAILNVNRESWDA